MCLGLSTSTFAAPGDAPTINKQSQVVVSSLSQLQSTLKQVRVSTTILVAPGRYKSLKLYDISIPFGTVIKSIDEKRHAEFEGFTLSNVKGLKLADLDIIAPSKGPMNGRYGAFVVHSKNIELQGLRFVGPGKAFDRRYVSALMLRSSTDITVSNSYFTNFWHGLSMLDLENSVIERNEFEGLQTDGIRGGGVSNLTIKGNVITDFTPARSDHPDGIQLWSNDQDEPGRNITIQDNIVVRGKGAPTQGIFIRDTYAKLPFENLQIIGNLVIGGRYNGISVGGAIVVNVTGNTVIPFEDQKSWIRLEQTRRASVVNNSAGTFIFRNNPENPRSRGNVSIKPHDRNIAQIISRWARQKRAFSTYRGSVLLRLMSNGS